LTITKLTRHLYSYLAPKSNFTCLERVRKSQDTRSIPPLSPPFFLQIQPLHK